VRDPSLTELQRYLHREIPISRAMGVSVLHAGPEGVRLGMPLVPNLNHRGTLFGGSAAALGMLAAWTLVHERLRGEEGLTPHLVVQRSAMEYLEPVAGDVEAWAGPPPLEAWERFLRTFRRRKRARIEVEAELLWAGWRAAHLRGTFVAAERLDDARAAGDLR